MLRISNSHSGQVCGIGVCRWGAVIAVWAVEVLAVAVVVAVVVAAMVGHPLKY
jgi:hypothetical protein